MAMNSTKACTTRRHFLATSAAALGVGAVASSLADANAKDQAHEGSGRKKNKSEPLMQMLFLPGEIGPRSNCVDHIEPMTKHPANPVLVGESPWEGKGVYWPSVLYSEKDKLFKMWYEVFDPTTKVQAAGVSKSCICYAYSKDGIRWEKPAIGKVKRAGHPDTNILIEDSGILGGVATVIEDTDDADPERRYKMLIYDKDSERDGARTAVSPDGINWKFVGGFPVLPTQDACSLWHDRRRGQYVAFLKARFNNRRSRMISVSKDFQTWSKPSLLLQPDVGDTSAMHHYGQSAFHHYGHDLGFLSRYDASSQMSDMELIAAPQGIDWRRLPKRDTVVARGDLGDWDSAGVYAGVGEPILVGDAYWYYYWGTNKLHDDEGEGGRTSIGIATFKPGRLAGQRFTGAGYFTSIPFRCPGGMLRLDAVASKPMTVEVHGTGYQGAHRDYSKAACRPVEGDSSEHPIRWQSKADLNELRGKFIQLRVYGNGSIVYGASFV